MKYLHKSWVWIVAGIIALTSIISSVSLASNIPLLDDYHLCLKFVNDFVSSQLDFPNFMEKRNGHLFITQKVVFLLDYLLFGEVDFRRIIVWNNVFFLAIFYLLCRVLRRSDMDLRFLIPILLIGCVPNFYLNNHSSSFLHFSTVFFSLLTFIYLDKKSAQSFILASLFALLAALSSGGGVLAYIAGLPLIWKRNRKRTLYLWIFQFLVLVVLYIIAPDSGSGADFSKIFSIGYWITVSGNFLLFYGSFFKPLYAHHSIWAPVLGLIGLVGLAIVGWKNRRSIMSHPLILSGILFGILLGLASTAMRSQYGLGSTTSDRYRLYQFIFWTFTYLLITLLYSTRSKTWYPWILCFMILMYGFKMQDSLVEMIHRKMQLTEGAILYRAMGDVGQLTYRDQAQAGSVLNESGSLGVYDMSKVSLDLTIPDFNPQILNVGMLKVSLAEYLWEDEVLHLEGWIYTDVITGDRDRIIFFVDRNGNREYYHTGPIITAGNWLPPRVNSFSVTIDHISRNPDFEMGVGIYRRGVGVVAEEDISVSGQL